MKLSTYIAKRFLLGGKESGVSKFTGWIAIIGMAVGSFSLVLSMAVLNGFEQRVTEKIRGFEGDLRLSANEKTLTECSTNYLTKKTTVETMPFMERKGLIHGAGESPKLVTFKAVEMNRLTEFYQINSEFATVDVSSDAVVIGRLLANRLDVHIGDTVMLMSPIDQPSTFGLPHRIQATAAGIFSANVLDYDDRLVFIPLKIGEKLFTRKRGYDGVDLRFEDASAMEMTRLELNADYPSITTRSWDRIHQGLFQAMKMERVGAIAVLSLIILVASFNLTSTLVLITVQKIRPIGILRTIGATSSTIRSILIKQGLMIGSIGVSIGLVLSLLIVGTQYYFNVLPLPEDVYFMDTLPMILTPIDVILVPMIAILLISLSSLSAAKRAVLILPKDAVHIEK